MRIPNHFIVFFYPLAVAKLNEVPSSPYKERSILSSEENAAATFNEQRKSLSSTILTLNEWYFNQQEEHSSILEEEEIMMEEQASLMIDDIDHGSKRSYIHLSGKQRENTTETTDFCEDPVAAVLKTMKCIEDGDVGCSHEGYNSRKFRKLHNGIDTETQMNYFFWFGAFRLLTFELDIDHIYKMEGNTIGIRYIEKVTTTDGTSLFLQPSYTTPYNQTYYQHEHAIVTVDEDCKMILWDQTGDNKEQTDVEDIADEIVCKVNPFCF